MKTFLIERELDGISMPDLHGVIAASLRQVARMREDGDLIHYLGSTFLPAEGLCLCLFQAKDETVLTSLNQAARLPVRRIVPAIALARSDGGRLFADGRFSVTLSVQAAPDRSG